MAKKKLAGIGAAGSGKARFFCPREHICAQWPNEHQRIRLAGVLIVGKGMHKVNRREQLCYECRIPEIDNGVIFHITCKNFKVEVDGATPFEDEVVVRVPTTPQPTAQATAAAGDRTSVHDVAPNVRGVLAEEIAELRQQGIEVDDDNEPAPENAQPAPRSTVPVVGLWVTPTTCPRRADTNCRQSRGMWKTATWAQIREKDELQLFRMCFPEQWVEEVLIPSTNKILKEEDIDLQEFYIFLGCHFFMACFEGVSDRQDWWSSKPVRFEEGAPFRLNKYMSLRRFTAITAAVRYTNHPPPATFVDRFHEVRQMIDAFNTHYLENYTPSWLSCLDESMNSWLDKYCPGFMTVPRKPHPLGNEYHSIADGDAGKPVMWRIKI